MSKKYRILVVDDSAGTRDLVEDMLISIGHIPCLAENDVAALTEIGKRIPDLILLDIMMPEVSGFQLLERLKSDSSLAHIPVIMISALDDAESIVRCVKLGAADLRGALPPHGANTSRRLPTRNRWPQCSEQWMVTKGLSQCVAL